MKRFLRVLFGLSWMALTGCGGQMGLSPGAAPQATSCTPGVATIGIMDGVMKRFCGCTEASETVIIPPNTLTCTISKGNSVHFIFVGTTLQHQIRSSGSSAATTMISSPVVSGTSSTVRSYGLTFGSSGTFPFVDTFYSGLSGQIIVN